MTGHSSQSLTVERAFVLAPDHGEHREWGYMALSRARRATRIYVTEAALEIETHATGRGLNRLARVLTALAARPLAHAVDRDRAIGLAHEQWSLQRGSCVSCGGRQPSLSVPFSSRVGEARRTHDSPGSS